MANTVAVAIGHHKTSTTEGSRLGTVAAEGRASTRDTFTTCFVNADGSGYVQVERLIGKERVCVGRMEFGPEGARGERTTILSGKGFITGRSATTGSPILDRLDHEPWMGDKEQQPRRCPCGQMTANDCAGECGKYVGVHP